MTDQVILTSFEPQMAPVRMANYHGKKLAFVFDEKIVPLGTRLKLASFKGHQNFVRAVLLLTDGNDPDGVATYWGHKNRSKVIIGCTEQAKKIRVFGSTEATAEFEPHSITVDLFYDDMKKLILKGEAKKAADKAAANAAKKAAMHAKPKPLKPEPKLEPIRLDESWAYAPPEEPASPEPRQFSRKFPRPSPVTQADYDAATWHRNQINTIVKRMDGRVSLIVVDGVLHIALGK